MAHISRMVSVNQYCRQGDGGK